MRLAAKFTLLLVVGFVVLFAVDGFLAVQRDIRMFDDDMRDDAQELAEHLRPIIAEYWERGGDDQVDQFLARINTGEAQDWNQVTRVHRLRWVLLDADPNEARCPMATGAELQQVVASRVFSVKHTEQGQVHMVTYAQVAVGGPRPAALEVMEPLDHTAERMNSFARRLVMLLTVTLLLGVGMVVVVGRELVGKPLELLIEKTRRIGQGDYSGPVEMQRRDEFGELGNAINSMCDELVEAQQQVNSEMAARIAALEQLRHVDRLRTVGRLASGIAHEIGTPLNVIGGRAELIGSGALSAEDTQASASIIKAESDRITTIVRQLLDFARRSTPSRADVDLNQIIRQTTHLLEPLAEKNDVRIEYDGEASYPCQVDAGQIQQLLTNLMVNAIHAMPNGGKVQVDVRVQRVGTVESPLPPSQDQAKPGEYLLVSIQDQGIGIETDDLDHIFEPFFTTKKVGEGTGLGLSIAYGIAQEHGGWIAVDSAVGRGSCFTVYLPLEADV